MTTRGTGRRDAGTRGGAARGADPAPTGWPVAERSALATVLGIPPLAAVALALVLTGLGVFIDVLRIGTVGAVFSIAYVLGCVLAVTWVRRRNLFGPMVQPPLLAAVLIPVVVLLVGRSGGGLTETVLMIGAPLVNAFPTMAVATGLSLLIGLVRLIVQRTGPEDALSRLGGLGVRSEPVSERRDSGAARGGGRTSGSPRRS
ncbi:DUF6542 domain-containing protein [Pseudonocardia sp. WMMC193]|uniref:DUF6542 domain-containing protein n=1 Tax=Pseudonocardia sp. WMMC193 TaxID=2911965 RepID=UPI001F43565C|nr:DUF6542 domain-containing protein [Pseudonocardia sp. WMMC193]MCF7551191.1 hypothetical protein [Pseudonocardia sp. WMMC193]